MDIKYPVMCPLMEEEIDAGICFDIHMVVERIAPKRTAPKKIYEKDDYEDICNNCKYHRND